ncbi:MAG: MmcQ/YjbR family DNA-binding protein [Ignavibacteriae bacterium]|nr:MmcQ/YjbR family DNA-binding protein [Ignavibacteriota bacterium]
MNLESVKTYCLSFPHATEKIMWDDDYVFKIGGKMFAIAATRPDAKYVLSFKCTPEKFAELTERNGIAPAPYAARYFWVSLERFDVLHQKEVKALLKESYEMVFEKLTKKLKKELLDA